MWLSEVGRGTKKVEKPCTIVNICLVPGCSRGCKFAKMWKNLQSLNIQWIQFYNGFQLLMDLINDFIAFNIKFN